MEVTMFIFKRGNGYYYVAYVDQKTGRRKHISTKTKYKSEANQFFANVKEEIKRREAMEIDPISLKDFRFKILKRSELMHTPKTTKIYNTSFK